MNHLLRERAPITEAAWSVIDDAARQRLVAGLAARKVVDFSGPLGWGYSASNLGRSDAIGAPADGVTARRRRVLPLVELRASFEVGLDELFDAERDRFGASHRREILRLERTPALCPSSNVGWIFVQHHQGGEPVDTPVGVARGMKQEARISANARMTGA